MLNPHLSLVQAVILMVINMWKHNTIYSHFTRHDFVSFSTKEPKKQLKNFVSICVSKIMDMSRKLEPFSLRFAALSSMVAGIVMKLMGLFQQ